MPRRLPHGGTASIGGNDLFGQIQPGIVPARQAVARPRAHSPRGLDTRFWASSAGVPSLAAGLRTSAWRLGSRLQIDRPRQGVEPVPGRCTAGAAPQWSLAVAAQADAHWLAGPPLSAARLEGRSWSARPWRRSGQSAARARGPAKLRLARSRQKALRSACAGLCAERSWREPFVANKDEVVVW